MSTVLSGSPNIRDLLKYTDVFIKGAKCWWIDSVGRDPSLFVWVRLSGSSIARNLKKYSEVLIEGVKCWRIDSVGRGRTRPVSLCVGSTERKFDRWKLGKIH